MLGWRSKGFLRLSRVILECAPHLSRLVGEHTAKVRHLIKLPVILVVVVFVKLLVLATESQREGVLVDFTFRSVPATESQREGVLVDFTFRSDSEIRIHHRLPLSLSELTLSGVIEEVKAFLGELSVIVECAPLHETSLYNVRPSGDRADVIFPHGEDDPSNNLLDHERFHAYNENLFSLTGREKGPPVEPDERRDDVGSEDCVDADLHVVLAFLN